MTSNANCMSLRLKTEPSYMQYLYLYCIFDVHVIIGIYSLEDKYKYWDNLSISPWRFMQATMNVLSSRDLRNVICEGQIGMDSRQAKWVEKYRKYYFKHWHDMNFV